MQYNAEQGKLNSIFYWSAGPRSFTAAPVFQCNTENKFPAAPALTVKNSQIKLYSKDKQCT